jgi:hypothetical protein
MGIVGKRFCRGEIYVPEILRSARAMNGGIKVVKPFLFGCRKKPGWTRARLHGQASFARHRQKFNRYDRDGLL